MDFEEGEAFNISTGVETTINQVFEAIEENLKSGLKPQYGPARVGDVFRNSLSPEKAEKLLNWKAQYKFADGVKKTIEFYKKN